MWVVHVLEASRRGPLLRLPRGGAPRHAPLSTGKASGPAGVRRVAARPRRCPAPRHSPPEGSKEPQGSPDGGQEAGGSLGRVGRKGGEQGWGRVASRVGEGGGRTASRVGGGRRAGLGERQVGEGETGVCLHTAEQPRAPVFLYCSAHNPPAARAQAHAVPRQVSPGYTCALRALPCSLDAGCRRHPPPAAARRTERSRRSHTRSCTAGQVGGGERSAGRQVGGGGGISMR